MSAQARSLLMTNTQYLKAPVEDTDIKLTHGGAAGVIIGICLVRRRRVSPPRCLLSSPPR